MEETELDLDPWVRRLMTAWMARWGELSPEHQAKFLETAEFRELALIPEEFGRKAINSFKQRKQILREAKRLQNKRKRQAARLQNERKRQAARLQNERMRAARLQNERKRQAAPGSEKPLAKKKAAEKTSLAGRCPACGMAVSIDGKCRCS